MLKFLKEDNNFAGKTDAAESGASATADSKQDGRNDGYLTPVSRDKSVKRGTIVLAVVFAVGMVALFVMIKKSGPDSAAAQAVKESTGIELALSKLTGIKKQFLSRMDQIVKKFYEFSSIEQVEVYELQKNPFEYEKGFDSLTVEPDRNESDEDRSALIESRLARQMQLLSIMKTDKGRCCMINDTLLYEGDVIDGFRVASIGTNSVELRTEGLKFILRIASD